MQKKVVATNDNVWKLVHDAIEQNGNDCDLNFIDVSKVTDMSYLFYKCTTLSSLPDISNWNISNVNNMNYIFYNCTKLSSLPEI